MYFQDDIGNKYEVASIKDYAGSVLLIQTRGMLYPDEIRNVIDNIQQAVGDKCRVVDVPPGFKVIGCVRADGGYINGQDGG